MLSFDIYQSEESVQALRKLRLTDSLPCIAIWNSCEFVSSETWYFSLMKIEEKPSQNFGSWHWSKDLSCSTLPGTRLRAPQHFSWTSTSWLPLNSEWNFLQRAFPYFQTSSKLLGSHCSVNFSQVYPNEVSIESTPSVSCFCKNLCALSMSCFLALSLLFKS